MPAKINIIGRRFGINIVLKDAPGTLTAGGKKIRQVEIQCTLCQRIRMVRNIGLLAGKWDSCQCQRGGNIAASAQVKRSAKIQPAKVVKPKGRKRVYFVKIGQCFGNWTVIQEAVRGNTHYEVACRCVCGNETSVIISHLFSGVSQGCGCVRPIVHGHSRRGKLTPTYRTWQAMMARCHRKGCEKYKDYGGKGITVCEEWREFVGFLRGAGEAQKGTTIDRLDNAKGYEPGNVRWATTFEQAENKRASQKHTIRGFTGCLAAVCRHFGTNYARTRMRIVKFGWLVEDAVFTPSKTNR